MAALVMFGAAWRSGGASPAAGAALPLGAIQPRVFILGFDGFARRYLDTDSTPALHAFARGGVTARWMVPSFPTLTFPNFYALATGLYPDHSGIVSNGFVDPKFDSAFVYKDPIAR
jgi:predicted AlkP superfamily pyrophosphatase or phosphodiesterase